MNEAKAESRILDNVGKLGRIMNRLGAYRKLTVDMLTKGIPLADILRTQFPFILPDAKRPPIVSLELTNICNLACVYCLTPLTLRPKGMMSDETFRSIVDGLRDTGKTRVRVVGLGEATLHPHFIDHILALREVTGYLSILTNGQWTDDRIAPLLTRIPIDLIEFSIDAGGKEQYEASRKGASYDRLISNLKSIRESINRGKVRALINIRLMVRPSQSHSFRAEQREWLRYADTVMPQFIVNKRKPTSTTTQDIYTAKHAVNQLYPRCSLPFKDFDVNWDGQVALCYMSASQIGYPGKIIGNVNEKSIRELWNCETMRDYRLGHRYKEYQKIGMCKGCIGS